MYMMAINIREYNRHPIAQQIGGSVGKSGQWDNLCQQKIINGGSLTCQTIWGNFSFQSKFRRD